MQELIKENWDTLTKRIDEKCGGQIGKDTNISSGFYNQKANCEWDKVKDSQMILGGNLGVGASRATVEEKEVEDKIVDDPEKTKDTTDEEMAEPKEEEGGMFKNIMEKLFK